MEKQLSAIKDNFPGQVIPGRIVIGVTGHRSIQSTPQLQATIQTVLNKIVEMAPVLKATPVVFSVLTPLAEGADRLIAREVLKIGGAMLEVVLPLERDLYVQDFSSEDSVKEFDDLLGKARYVRVISSKESRDSAYESAGRYIVEQCDVLVAIWDGKPSGGRGGTEEIVTYARNNKCPFIRINSENYAQVEYNLGQGLNGQALHDLDSYNLLKINNRKMALRLERENKSLQEITARSGLPVEKITRIINSLIGHYIRADEIAVRFQHTYYRAEIWVYVLALAAVITAAFQVQFFPQYPVILVAEMAVLFAMQGTVIFSRKSRWQEKWLDSRFLAERLRTAIFMATANFNVSALKPPRHLSLSHSPKDWMVTAFLTIWEMKPHSPLLFVESLESVKKFLTEAWLDDQISYFENTSKRYNVNHKRITFINYLSFSLTLIIILLSVLEVDVGNTGTALSLLAVIFPAFASTLVALRTRRDYQRISIRYDEMVRHLKELKGRMTNAIVQEEFFDVVKEIEETMLYENEDWRVVVRFKKTEAPPK